ncbi:hypothetical protein [Methylobacter sp. YRD-M1]|uniref:hypothetical protein n=1 Tax=Methylobacter sp. YRD-M1 TaxID=2911520 RepID=UPI00227B61C2|nr:hypothetical protein [Methylobacter sp. YRD-M1]WAK03623.1 hypothetical protein LZ558_07540 [Methylobacter sp. YRD-M1]
MTSSPISLNPGLIARTLGVLAFLLVIASIAGQLMSYITGDGRLYGFVSLFNVDAEHNIPTFFTVFLLLSAALLLSVITILEKYRRASHVSHWLILSFGFLFMAIDELVSIHERLIKPIRNLLGDGNLGVFYFAWVILGIALILFLAWFFLRFWLHLPAKTRLTFFMAAVLYVGGSIGFEMIGGRYAELHGLEDLTYKMIATAEESLEMAGIILFIRGLLVYIAENHREVRFRFGGS